MEAPIPYASIKQSAYIHSQAAKGVAWAVKFVRDSHGSKVPHTKHVRRKRRKGRRMR